MKTQIKTALLCLSLLCGAGYLISCNKSSTAAPASIVGTWSGTSLEEKKTYGSAVIIDTTIQYATGQATYIFTADGYYLTLSSGSSPTGGVYTISGNTLSVLDTSHADGHWLRIGAHVDAHALQLVDTLFHQGDTLGLFILNYTR